MISVSRPTVRSPSPTNAMRPEVTATLASCNSPEYTLAIVPPRTKRSAGRSPRAVSTSLACSSSSASTGLDCLVADHGVCHLFDVPVPLQVFEVGQRLGEREAELMGGEVLGEDAARDLEGRCRLAVEGGEHCREALLVVREEFVYAPVHVVKKRTVPREDEIHAKAPQPFKGIEVAPERPRGRVGPEPDVRRDLEQQVVSGEQELASLVVQDEVKIGVAWRVHHPRLAASELERVSRPQWDQALRQADAELRGPGRRFRRLRVHAVADQIPHEVFRSPVRVPDVTGVLDLSLEHPDWRPTPLFQPAGESYVIRVQVRHDDPPQVTLEVQTNLCGADLPGSAGWRIVEAWVYDRPPVAVLD